MTGPLSYTLLTDGSSDRCLIPVIEWVLEGIPEVRERGWVGSWADLGRAREPTRGLGDRADEACRRYPCDILFVHRDAEAQELERRQEEIRSATRSLVQPDVIPVVPVRMTEAWLLLDERAIRLAAGNPGGRARLRLPRPGDLEGLPDPKERLEEALVVACELAPRRLARFRRRIRWRIHRLAELVEDFAPLRQLHAFRVFESSALEVLARPRRYP